MKLFQKRSDTIDTDDERLSDYVPHAERNQHGVYEPPEGSSESTPQTSSIEYSPKRQSLGVLVRKLNCASSKKHDDYDYDGMYGEIDDYGEANSITSPPRKSASSQHWNQPKPEITRPVLITVKNGDVKEQLPLYEENDNKNMEHLENALTNSFIVGDVSGEDVGPPSKMCTTLSFKRGMSARRRSFKYQKQEDNDNDWSRSSGTFSGGGLPNNNPEDYKELEKEIERRRAAQEASRRERWKRGLEMENRMAKQTRPWAKLSPGRDKDGDDSSSDSRTTGSHTTGTSSTTYDSLEDSSTVDDWTDATDESPRRYNYYSYPGNCTNGHQLVQGVAEDFGIFAQLLLKDGVACLGTAAEITKETYGNCQDKPRERRPSEQPARRPTEQRRNGRRRWGRRQQV